uniref:hypothetical protein n=1 Tax=Rhodococcus opacus TaxID=37919 RepID=UPI0027E18617|nr:hypothetical protein [Rhodococcus opacus]
MQPQPAAASRWWPDWWRTAPTHRGPVPLPPSTAPAVTPSTTTDTTRSAALSATPTSPNSGTTSETPVSPARRKLSSTSSGPRTSCRWTPTGFPTGRSTTPDVAGVDPDGIRHPDQPGRSGKADPATYVRDDSPPIFIAHGLADPIVPYPQSEILFAAYENAEATASLTLVVTPGRA